MLGGKNILFAVMIAALTGGIGFFAGSAYQMTGTKEAIKEKESATFQEEKTSPEKVTLESNKVVKFVSKSVSGKVKSVSGDKLTLEDGGDTLSFVVSPQARISRIAIPSPTAFPEGAEAPVVPVQEPISLSQIRVGDRVDATLTDQPDGSFAATEVTVLVE